MALSHQHVQAARHAEQSHPGAAGSGQAKPERDPRAEVVGIYRKWSCEQTPRQVAGLWCQASAACAAKGSILSHQNVCRRAARGKNQLGINSNAVRQANNPPCMVDSAARGLPFSCSIIQPKLKLKYILSQIQKGLPGIVPPFIGRQRKTQQTIFHLAGAASAGHLRPASKLL